ncbi:alpha-ketoglutarate-dependent dioxygenase AlkB [Vibrio fluvialis]|uniref:alpha-ketoglutarate-dependent dioxygenase AlkB family protein n=1 Tax=Vibrio fluvialis TaxID=676 RepID=UPI000509E416|nr:alpha-ketoglutarate-dependent dioxygenase AlkB [Vibrio fluvialis]EKO3485736.1 alpha-ketoglutarate-dependent dioxygenase AlkB [Vibrio fluvialis]
MESENFSLFADEPQWLPITDGKLLWAEHFLTPTQADHAFSVLTQELDWQQEAITLFGKSVLQPRLQAWYGDKAYTYSGLTMLPKAWSPMLADLKQRCELLAGQAFNSVLANLYRDGQDSMGWHQDNEPELGQQPVIASLSLGETRRFVLRHLHSKEKFELPLSHGSLLIMAGNTQHFWQHCVPKTVRALEPRINLTFRLIHGDG